MCVCVTYNNHWWLVYSFVVVFNYHSSSSVFEPRMGESLAPNVKYPRTDNLDIWWATPQLLFSALNDPSPHHWHVFFRGKVQDLLTQLWIRCRKMGRSLVSASQGFLTLPCSGEVQTFWRNGDVIDYIQMHWNWNANSQWISCWTHIFLFFLMALNTQ